LYTIRSLGTVNEMWRRCDVVRATIAENTFVPDCITIVKSRQQQRTEKLRLTMSAGCRLMSLKRGNGKIVSRLLLRTSRNFHTRS